MADVSLDFDFEVIDNFTKELKSLQKQISKLAKSDPLGSLDDQVNDTKDETNKLVKVFRKAVKSVKGFGSSGRKAFNGITKVAQSLQLPIIALNQGLDLLSKVFGPIISGITSVITAANIQEVAVSKLNTALKLSGEFTEQASKEMQDFASNLQQVTGIGDETTLEMLALAKSFGFTNEEAKKVTEAAAEFSTVAGINFEEALRRIGRSAQGSVDDISKFAPEVKNLTKAQLAAGGAADLLIKRFGGASAAILQTFSGQVKLLEGNFGDTLEVIGQFIIGNDSLRAAVGSLNEIFLNLQKIIKNNEGTIKKFINDAILFLADAFIILLRVGEGLSAFLFVLLNPLDLLSAAFISLADTVVSSFLDVLEAINIGGLLDRDISDLKKIQKDIRLASNQIFEDLQKDAEAFQLVGSAVDSAVSKIKEFKKSLDDVSDKKTVEITVKAKGEFKKLGKSLKEIEAEAKKAGEVFDTLSKTLSTSLASETERVLASLNERQAIVDKALELGETNEKKASEIRIKILQDADMKIVAIQKKQNDEKIKLAEESAKKQLEASRAFLTEGIGGGLIQAGKALTQGASSAKNFVVQSLRAIPDPISQAAAQIIEVFAVSGEQFKKQVESATEFLATAPTLIAQNIPVFIEALVAAIPQVIQGLNDALPLLLDGLIALVQDPAFAQSLADAITAAAIRGFTNPFFIASAVKGFQIALVRAVPVFISRLVPGLVNAFAEQLEPIFGGFQDAIGSFNEAVGFFKDVVDDIKDALSGGGIGGKLGGIGKSIAGGIKSVGKTFGFQDGITEVPSGFKNDSFLAGLSEGERVVDANTNQDLKAFLNNQNALQPLTVIFQVGEKELAEMQVMLDRGGFRRSG